MKNNVVFILLIIIAISSCSDKRTFEVFPETRNLKVKDSICFSESVIGMPFDYHVLDSLLFIVDVKNTKLFHIYDLKSKKFLKNFGDKGHGPGELLSPGISIISQDKKLFLVRDVTSIFVYNIDSILNSIKTTPERIIKTPEEIQSIVGFDMISDSVFVIYGSYAKNRLAFMNFNGDFIKTAGKVNKESRYGGDFEHNNSQRAILAVNIDSSKIILSNIYTDKIEVYNLNGDLINEIIGPYGYSHAYNITKEGSYKMDINKTNFAYFDLYAGNEYIYGLFSGYSYPEIIKSNGILAAHCIHIFNYQGDPIIKFNLDKNLRQMHLFDNSSRIIGNELENPDYLFLYDLPPLP